MRVIVTRPAPQASALVQSLQARGVDAVALPLIDIVPLSDPTGLRQAWQSLASDSLVFFVSANAVQHFFQARPEGMAWPAATLAAGPGPGTDEALRVAGVPDAMRLGPPPGSTRFDSEALWEVLRLRRWHGCRALVVRGEDGRDWLAEQLSASGAEVRYLPAYARHAALPGVPEQALLAAARASPRQHLWWFSSSEAVRNLRQMWGPPPPEARALATHPRIAQAARAAGFAEVREAPPGESGLLQALAAGGSIQFDDP